MLKKSPNRVLDSPQSSTCPHGKERVLARLGWEGEIGYASGCASPAALLDGFFEHPVHEVFRDLWIRSC
jgi:hypothetical protein